MTQINFSFAKPRPLGTLAPVYGTLRFVPTLTRVVHGTPDTLVLPVPFPLTVQPDGTATVDLEPTTDYWVWKITVSLNGVDEYTEYVTVPDGEPLDYTDLQRIHPDSLNINSIPEAVWWETANKTVRSVSVVDGNLIATRADGTSFNAGKLPDNRGPRGFKGDTGAQGRQGIQGDKGDKGDTGDVGPMFAPKQQDVQKWETLNASALLRFHAALGNIHNAPCNVMFAGHSMMVGFNSTKGVDRVAESSLTALRRHVGVPGGIGFKKMKHPNNFTDYPITGTLSGLNPYGLGGTDEAVWISSTSGPATVNIPAGHTAVDIAYTSNPGNGTFSWALNGGAATNVSTDAPINGYRTARVALPNSNAHTLTIGFVSGSSILNGVMFYNGDENKGIRGFEAARSGNTSTMYLNLAMNVNPITWQDAITALNPALVVFTILCNDYSNGSPGANPVPSATSKANIKAIIDKIAAKCTTRPSVVLCVENQRGNETVTEPWSKYVQAAYDLAEAEGYAVFDLHKRWGGGGPDAATAAGLLSDDKIHPSNSGHRYWGESLASFLTP